MPSLVFLALLSLRRCQFELECFEGLTVCSLIHPFAVGRMPQFLATWMSLQGCPSNLLWWLLPEGVIQERKPNGNHKPFLTSETMHCHFFCIPLVSQMNSAQDGRGLLYLVNARKKTILGGFLENVHPFREASHPPPPVKQNAHSAQDPSFIFRGVQIFEQDQSCLNRF